MYKVNRYKQEVLNRALIQKYLDNKLGNEDYLRYLIDHIYDDICGICPTCNNGIALEVLKGDYAYFQCDNCNDIFH